MPLRQEDRKEHKGKIERQSLISTSLLQQVCIRFTSSLHQEYYKSTSKDEKKECKMKNVKCKKGG
jgi:hypothetical protein